MPPLARGGGSEAGPQASGVHAAAWFKGETELTASDSDDGLTAPGELCNTSMCLREISCMPGSQVAHWSAQDGRQQVHQKPADLARERRFAHPPPGPHTHAVPLI